MGVAVLVQNPLTQRALGIISVFFLMYLAITGIRAELRTPQPSQHPTAEPPQRRNAFFTGMFLSLTNPWAIGFWLSLGGTLASYGAMESGNTMAVFFLSFFGACLVYAFSMAFLIGVTRKAIPPKTRQMDFDFVQRHYRYFRNRCGDTGYPIISDWLDAMKHTSNQNQKLL